MNDSFTPSVFEVRVAYSVAGDTAPHGAAYRQAYERGRDVYGPEFDRWLAAHEVKVRAEALRVAADAICDPGGPFGIGGEGDDAGQWLHRRADAIEGETDRG